MGKQLFLRLRWLIWLSAAAPAGAALALGTANPPSGLLPWVALAVLCADAAALGVVVAILLERRPRRGVATPTAWRERHEQLSAVRHLLERHGEDSISPFILRPDKAYAFAGGGVLAYRVFGRTAVVSGDPVGPPGSEAAVLQAFLATARARGWEVVVYGASAERLETYHRLGLRSICAGEEAVVRPDGFSLDGRRVRKLRQSVRRVQRRGWEISVHDGVDIDPVTEAELGALEARWRAAHPRLLGFAMSMGPFESGVAAGDLYLLARSPEGELAAAMRFIAHRGRLSLGTMRRVGETPNGLNEALVCRALEVARERGIPEVSLNYAGLAHLIRRPLPGGWLRRRALGFALSLLGRRFQMERLVRFNEKFLPEWRPRYLVFPSRRALPRAVYRVLQAEGYIAPRRSSRAAEASAAAPRPPAAILPVGADSPGS